MRECTRWELEKGRDEEKRKRSIEKESERVSLSRVERENRQNGQRRERYIHLNTPQIIPLFYGILVFVSFFIKFTHSMYIPIQNVENVEKGEKGRVEKREKGGVSYKLLLLSSLSLETLSYLLSILGLIILWLPDYTSCGGEWKGKTVHLYTKESI